MASCASPEEETESEEESDIEDVIGVPLPDVEDDIRDAGLILPPSSSYWTFHEAGKRLHAKSWVPAHPSMARGTVFWVHGYTSYVSAKALDELGTRMATEGFATFAFDCPGHGYSPGERAFIESFKDFEAAYLQFFHLVRNSASAASHEYDLGCSTDMLQNLQQRPFFISGESMGGALTLQLESAAGSWPLFRGIVLVAPALATDMPPKFVRDALKATIVQWAPSGIMPAFLSNSAQILPDQIARDPLEQDVIKRNDYGTAKGALGWRKGMKWATANAFVEFFEALEYHVQASCCPMLILHDPEDEICLYSGSENFMELSESKDKTLIPMFDSLHDLVCNENEAVAGHMLDWMGLRL